MARGLGKLLRQARRIPFVGKALRAVPGVGTALVAADIGYSLFKSGSVASGGGMPPLPNMSGVGGMIPFDPNMGKRSIFRDDPNVMEALKGFAIPARDLKEYFRAPRGFVVMRDKNNDPFGIPKIIAKKWLGYREADKPPISVRDWNSLKRADSVIKKFRKIEQRAMRIGNFGRRGKSPFEAAAAAAGKKAMFKAVGRMAA